MIALVVTVIVLVAIVLVVGLVGIGSLPMPPCIPIAPAVAGSVRPEINQIILTMRYHHVVLGDTHCVLDLHKMVVTPCDCEDDSKKLRKMLCADEIKDQNPMWFPLHAGPSPV